MPPMEPEAPTLVAVQTEDGDLLESTIAADGRSSSPDPFPDLRRGDVLGRYVVLDMLGHGGMGVVYAAYDPELDRKVAVKLVKCRSGSGRGSAGRSRLLREAQALARLTHPNVVGVYDVGTWRDSVFVAMEFIEGENVATWIDRRHAERPPSWREVLDVMRPAGRGLVAAHAAGIVHRDFKPENVMLSDTGRVIVLDFGLARSSEGGPDSLSMSDDVDVPRGSGSMLERLTATGSVMGTPAYMSPEQLGAGLSNEASDQFSYCISLYHALYGSRPFGGDTLPELTDAVLSGAVQAAPRGSKVPAWLRRVVLRGLSIDASERYPSMEALLAELSRDPARHRTRILVGVGALGLLGGSLAFARHWGTPEDSCARVEHAMSDAWGAPQREALERAFRSEAKTYSEQSIERVEGALEDYAARWVEERRIACEAATQVGTDEGRAAGLSAACLDQRLRRFEALVQLFSHADQSMVAKAMSAVQELPDPSECRDGERYREAQPLPEDAAAQAQVESLRLRMSEIHLMAVTGQLTEAEALLPALLDEARAQDFAPVLGEALLVHGGTKAQLGKYAQAQTSLEEGLMIARSHGLEQLEADLLSPLIFINTAVTSEFALADWQARTLEILVVRLDPSPSKKATVLIDRARLERTRGRYAKAIELGERAIELFERDDGAQQRLVLAYDHLATAYMEGERYDDAARILERAEELAATALGPDHPHRGNLLAHSARVEAGRGNHAASAAKLRAALQIFEGAYGGYHPNVSAVLNGLALQLEAMGQTREAVTTYLRAQELVIQAYGEDHAQVAIINANLGNALRRSGEAEEALRLHRSVRMLRERNETEIQKRYEILDNIGDDLRVLGRCEEARVEYQAANELRRSVGTEEETGASYALLGMGLCQWQQRDLPGAQQTLERALAIARGEADDDRWSRQTLALVRASMAMVLRERRTSPERVEVLAKRARAFWAAGAEEHAVHLKELDAWRAGGPAKMPTY